MLDCCSNVLFSLMVFPVFAQYFRKVAELLGNPIKTGKARTFLEIWFQDFKHQTYEAFLNLTVC